MGGAWEQMTVWDLNLPSAGCSLDDDIDGVVGIPRSKMAVPAIV